MLIRPVDLSDHDAVWEILQPVVRAGETYALPRDMSREDALAYWIAADRETFVAEVEGRVLGTYYLRANQMGGGAHVANCGYVIHSDAGGRGIARAMCEHSLRHALALGYRAMQFNFVLASNRRAVNLWQKIGFQTLGRIPEAFQHPQLGLVDALIMFLPLSSMRS